MPPIWYEISAIGQMSATWMSISMPSSARSRPSGSGVLLVDAWATMQAECREKLRQIDALGKPWIQIVVPWNRKDTEILDVRT